MKRGFLNTPRAKRVIEEVYAPHSPPGPKPSPQENPSPRRTQDRGEPEVVAAEDAVDMETTAVGDPYVLPRALAIVFFVRDSDAVAGVGPTQRIALPRARQNCPRSIMIMSTSRPYSNRTWARSSYAFFDSARTKLPSRDPKGKAKEVHMDIADDASPEDIMYVILPHCHCVQLYAPLISPRFSATGLIPPRPYPGRRGWGRQRDEEIFHLVPQLYGGPHVKRAVFRVWPRDPNGMVIESQQPRGTLSPDGYPWGSTLYDIFAVYRFPKIPNIVSTMSGSGILEAMEELGELDTAAPEIEWARSEGKPRVEGVADTEKLIECMDQMVYGVVSMLDDTPRTASPVRMDKEGANKRTSEDGTGQKGEHDEKPNEVDVAQQAPKDEDHDDESEEASEPADEAEDESKIKHDDMEVDPASIPPPPTIPVTSPFHPSHYPKPWPFIPFENSLPILLQERIPLYMLPQTLYVHDPFNLLSVRKKIFHNTSWSSRPDITRRYNLEFSGAIGKEVEEARRKAEELEELKARTLIVLRYKRTKEQIKNYEPVIEVPLPPYPRRMTQVEESHLYISPIARVGQGHHSIVYKGEWELPRDLFTKPKLCQRCFKESVDKEIKRLKDTGRWEKLLKAASWGPTGFTGRRPTKAELAEVSDPINLEKDGEILEREIICIVPPDVAPSEIFNSLVEEGRIWDTFMKKKDANTYIINLTEDGNESKSTKIPGAPTIRIDPPFSYESQKTCTHDSRWSQVAAPRTAKFTVVAKLSIENDVHLAREGSNYQQFPEHFFHHYSGYTIISQLHTTVPVHAVVPQFYGYYTPEDKSKHQTKEQYLSPILLLEHCGEPIDPEKLSSEDQNECASLLLRFQRAQWLHESVAPRNLLVQYGKPTEFPLRRESKPETSFRLIDFGRSRKYTTAEEKRKEELEVLQMFQGLRTTMNVTFSL